jgi:RNA polymerase primary sigma factor
MMERKNALNAYVDDIAAHQLLDDEQERAVAQRIQSGDHAAVSVLVEANLRFVLSLARQYARQGVPVEDLVEEGNMAMIKAAYRFRPEEGKRFVKFAAPIIRDALERAVEQQSGLYRVPRGEMNDAEMRRSHPVSVDAPIPAGSKNNFSLLNLLENHDAPYADNSFQNKDTEAYLQQIMSVLDEREQRVLSLVYGIGGDKHTMAETAVLMDIKRERVRQIRDKALRKLRKARRELSSLA